MRDSNQSCNQPEYAKDGDGYKKEKSLPLIHLLP